MLRLDDDRYCFACGENNPIGLRLTFDWDGEVLRTTFTPQRAHQGYKDVIHGGIVSTVLDEVMAWAAIKKLGKMAATVEFSVRFRKPLMAGQEAVAEGRLGKVAHRFADASATLTRATDGEVLATATAKLYITDSDVS